MNRYLYGLKSALFPILILSIFMTAGEPILANQMCSHLFSQTEASKRLSADDLFTLYTSKDSTPEAINLMLRQMEKIEIALFFNDFGFRVDKTSVKDASFILQLRNDNPYLDILKPFEQAGFQFAFSPSKSARDQMTVDWSTRTLWIDLRMHYPHNAGYQKADFLEFLKKTQDSQLDTYAARAYLLAKTPQGIHPQRNVWIFDYLAYRNGISTALDFSGQNAGILVLSEGNHRLNKISAALKKNYAMKLGWYQMKNVDAFFDSKNKLVASDISALTEGKVTSNLLHELRHLSFAHLRESLGRTFPWMSLHFSSEKSPLLFHEAYKDYAEAYSHSLVGDEIIARLSEINPAENRRQRDELENYNKLKKNLGPDSSEVRNFKFLELYNFSSSERPLEGISAIANAIQENMALVAEGATVTRTEWGLRLSSNGRHLDIYPLKISPDISQKNLIDLANEKIGKISIKANDVERIAYQIYEIRNEIRTNTNIGPRAAELRKKYFDLLAELNNSIKDTDEI